MAKNNFNPLKTAYTRAFLMEGRARGDHEPEYYSSMRFAGLSQSFGDITKIEMPDPNDYGAFIEVDRVRGSTERATSSLIGRYASALKSPLLRLAGVGCPIDVQLHIGQCNDPRNFNVFTKAVILEDVIITSYNTDDMGALESGENNPVNETAEISFRDIYEVTPLTFVEKAKDIITNEVVDIVIADSLSCGDCGDESAGCNKIYALTKAAGGSPGTSADIVFSLDKGATFAAHDVDSLEAAEEPDALAKVGDYIVVISGDSLSAHYALVSEFENDGDPSFAEVATGFVGAPRDICSFGRKAFIVGDSGYIYLMGEPADGVEVLDAGSATISDFIAVHALDEEHAVAVGEDGAIVYTVDGANWNLLATPPVGVGVDINAIVMKTQDIWWIGTSAGALWYTKNAGQNWTLKALPGTTPTRLDDVVFATDSVGYVSGVVSLHGRIWRTFDGGYSWKVLPEEASKAMPLSDDFGAIAACVYDADFVVAAGLADDASDGIIVVGNGS